MDLIVRYFLPDCDDDERLFAKKNLWISIPLFAVLVPAIFFVLYWMATSVLMNIGRIKFSMEPIGYNGLDFAQAGGAPVPPSFNVTLHAKSTFSWSKFCTSGRPTMEVMYSGVTIAKTDIESFCVGAKEEKVVVTATASSGWPALPSVFQESIDSDRRRHGKVHMEVGVSFSNEDHAEPYEERTWWVRCRTTLDADQAFPCTSYFVEGCYTD